MSSAQRVFDVLGASAGAVVFTPVMAAIAAAILLDDGGPVLFRQKRIGCRRQPFDVLKFRSMRDGEVTRVGRVLRATGLDELPQFVNIVRGDMSAVGPRPLTAADITRLGWDDPSCDFRWSCRPGLTGLAQLMGARAEWMLNLTDRIAVQAHVDGLQALTMSRFLVDQMTLWPSQARELRVGLGVMANFP